MKKLILFILALFTTSVVQGQEWVSDDSFDNAINGQSGFDDTDDIVCLLYTSPSPRDS